MTINTIARDTSEGMVSHYTEKQTGLIEGTRSLVGNQLYFGLRSVMRVVTVALRILNLWPALLLTAVSGDSTYIKNAGKLLGLSFVRLGTVPFQAALAVIGSLGQIFGLETGAKMLQASHEVDNWLDQYEGELDFEYQDGYSPDNEIYYGKELFLPYARKSVLEQVDGAKENMSSDPIEGA